MLDYFAIFTKGGALLWAFQLTALKGDPVNALIRGCLLEDRSAEASFTYNLPAGGGYTLKWSFQNVRSDVHPPLLYRVRMDLKSRFLLPTFTAF